MIGLGGSQGEQEFLERTGLKPNLERVPSHWKDLDSKGHGGHWVVPDCVVLDSEGNRCLIEYKHGNKLNTDGARKGKQAAEKKKMDYLSSSWGNWEARKRNAEAKMGWNHSIYRLIGMAQVYDRVLVVDPQLNKHMTDTDYLKVLNKAKGLGVEFRTISEFEAEFEDCLDVSVDDINRETVSETQCVTQLRNNT
ncbi:hypothetical protein VME0621_03874 [Vibrio mediterranei]|uniref:hypothetical protein n=1 Tax=Vibrio mediterranei TaxID=689 RepID=UPI0007854F1C|nr:hypothetical protein [Vibrio mediterranei]SBO11738.1 hypothetical protein VME0621_03874 [Vibrio mediterranei]